MISAKFVAKQAEKFAADNAPVILSAVGVVGAVTAAYLTGKATFKAADIIKKEEERLHLTTPHVVRGETFGPPVVETKDKVKLVWKTYLPAVGVLALSVGCSVCAHRVSMGRAAALAAAYSINDKRFTEYREKVSAKFNPNKERQVRDEIAQDRVKDNPPKDAQIIMVGHGDVICLDLPTGRYFQSNMEKLRSVQNDINAEVNEVGHSSLEFLYQSLGLKTTPYSSELGWTTSKMLDLHFSAVLTDNNQPCIAIDYQAEPIRGFRGHSEDPPF